MIIVTGIGRSGTSAVARVLHEKGGICFGHKFPPPNEFNPQGYYEDLEVTEELLDLLLNHELDPQDFWVKVYEIHTRHGCTEKPIGFKHPRMSYLTKDQWLELNPDLVIWCDRDRDPCVASMIKRRQGITIGGFDELWAYGRAELTYNIRRKKFERNLKHLDFTIVIDMNEHRSDEWILSNLNLIMC